MFVERHRVALTTDASGNATGYTAHVTGRVLAISYVKTDFANGVDITVSNDTTGQNLLVMTDVNASANYQPRLPTHDAAGAALLFASGGTPQSDAPVVANDRVKVVVAQGGDTKTGSVHVLVG